MGTDPAAGCVLLAIDGEPHTRPAIRWAIDCALEWDLPLVAVHVKDPYLKQFFNDIYAQGREEYLEHVESCLETRAREAVTEFEAAVAERGLVGEVLVRDGDPVGELLDEIGARDGATVVMGRRLKDGIEAWRSRDIPLKIVSRAGAVTVVVVPGEGEEV